MISPSERMVAEVEGAIGWITFNNPQRHNAVSVEMWQALSAILDHFERDAPVRVVVLKGAGEKAFISGADISEFEKHRSSADAVARYDEIADGAVQRLKSFRKPTIAMVHGYCLGGGVGVALACDLRIASDSARFAIPAARLGLGYRWSTLKTLVDMVGPAFAKEILITARQFSAAEAQSMGLINRAVPDGELTGHVRHYCDLIAQNAPLTIEAVKGVVRELGKPAAEIDRSYCEELVARCFASEDYIEGRRAFMEKRKPVFKGR